MQLIPLIFYLVIASRGEPNCRINLIVGWLLVGIEVASESVLLPIKQPTTVKYDGASQIYFKIVEMLAESHKSCA